MATSTRWKSLERDPLSSYRQLSIKGRRISRTLAGAYFSAEEPMTIEEIAVDWNVPFAEPIREGTSGQRDPLHLVHSIKTKRVFLTHNYDDFQDLDDLIKAAEGRHAVARDPCDSVADAR